MKRLITLFLIFSISISSINCNAQEPLQIGTETEDIFLTDNLNIAKAQVEKYPDNPEAHFNLAIALSRTSLVEDAIKELRVTKNLIRKPENAGVMDKKINEYKEMLKESNDSNYSNNIRYRLAFSHYLKAYLISKNIQKSKGKNQNKPKSLNLFSPNALSLNDRNPEIKKNLEESINYFKEQLKERPDDIWAKIYYGFILAEQYNDLTNAKRLWAEAHEQNPNNPAPHFFLGELKIKEGNLKEGILDISQAILLRSLGN